MTLIKSISGIRGTIGGQIGEGLTPFDTVKYAVAYGIWIKKRSSEKSPLIVVGRDARISGQMISDLVIASLQSVGINVIDLELSTTPTVEIAVPSENAQGGIILTASHNPKQWNALKLLNEKGEFLSAADGQEILLIAEQESFNFSEIDSIGTVVKDETYLQKHITAVLNLSLVNAELIRRKNFKIVVDAVNSSGGVYVPALLRALGVAEVIELYCEPTGHFPHNPEPLPENLTEISKKIKESKADLGIVVDPDVDRLAFVNEDGTMFGEEYTLVAVADYVLSNKKGNTVSNLSSTISLKEVTELHQGIYNAASVGEVNVVEKMKETNAVIGGEGNGGIIYPELHYGRDALVGIGLFLTHLAKSGLKASELRGEYPNYFISKNKIELDPTMNVNSILEMIASEYGNNDVDLQDGVKIYFENSEWVHLRKSNTEPIIRIYAESKNKESATKLAEVIISKINSLVTA